MKKIIISILIVLVLIISTFLITYKLIPYSLKDADRVCDIVLERTKPTALDYLRLDMNHDKEITMLDALLIAKKVYGENGSARTLKASEGSGNIPKVVNNLRIRKLTPKECLRLMGIKEEDINNMMKNQSDASLYHLAGDSIVCDVLMAIFKELL